MKLYRVVNEAELTFGVIMADSLESAKEKWRQRIWNRYGVGKYRFDMDEYIPWVMGDETDGVLLFD